MSRKIAIRSEVEALLPSGRRRRVRFSVSVPRRVQNHWKAEVRITGFGAQPFAVYGYDSMQAMTLSLVYIVSELELMKSRKVRLMFPGSNDHYDPRATIIDNRAAPKKNA